MTATTRKPRAKAPSRTTKDDIARTLRGTLDAIASSAASGTIEPIRAYMLTAEYAAATRIALAHGPAPAAVASDATPAKTATPAPVPAEPPRTFRIYTDGSCLANGTSRARGGWAYLIADGDEVTHSDSGGANGEAATNNAMELLAIERGLAHTAPGSRVVIATDSQVAIGWLFQGWQCNVEHNRRLVATIRKMMAERHVRHEKVKGHSSDRFNAKVDELAVAAARRHA